MQYVKKVVEILYGTKPPPFAGTVLAIDVSGSVGNCKAYWDVVSFELENRVGFDDLNVILWDDKCEKATVQALRQFIKNKTGRGGTSPHVIVQSMKRFDISFDSKLVLITDGQVSQHDVTKLDGMLGENHFAQVECHIISNRPQLSVTCPFTRGVACRVFTYENGLQSKKEELALTTQDFGIFDRLDTMTMAQFMEEYSKIESMLIALNMGKEGNPALKTKLINAEKRLIREGLAKDDEGLGAILLKALEEKDYQKAMAIAQALTDTFMQGNPDDFQSRMGHLVNLCGNLTGVYSVGAIKSMRVQRAPTVAAVEVADVPIVATQSPFQCPVFLEEDCPLIMIGKGDPLLKDEEKHVVDDILNCPLRILNRPNLVQKLRKRLLQPVGLKFFAEAVQKGKQVGKLINPFTNLQIEGVISLGCDKSHVKLGDQALAKLLTGGKRAGNFTLLYIVVWKLMKQIQYLAELSKHADQLLLYRLRHTWTGAGLCGLPNYNAIRVPTLAALWYSLVSVQLQVPAKNNPTRFHMFNADIMLEVLEFAGLKLPDDTLEALRLLKGLMSLLSYAKTSQNAKDYFRSSLIYRRVDMPQGFSEDPLLNEFKYYFAEQPASPQQIVAALSEARVSYLSAQQAMHLSSKVDRMLSSNDVPFNPKEVIPPLPQMQPYYNLPHKEPDIHFCLKTMRPIYRTEEGTWKDSFLKFFGIEFDKAKTLSLFKLYGSFVADKSKFPTELEFLAYLFRKGKNAGRPALPAEVQLSVSFVRGVIVQALGDSGISPAEFSTRFNNSAPIKLREELQRE